MEGKIHEKVANLLANGYDFDAGAVFNGGYRIFRRNMGSYIGFSLLTIVIALFLQFIPFIGILVHNFAVGQALAIGYALYARKEEMGKEPVDFGDFFKGFEHIVPLILMAITTTVIFLIVFSPSLIAFYNEGIVQWYIELLNAPIMDRGLMEPPSVSSNTILIFFINLIPVIYFGVAFIWAPHFIVFYKMNFWEAIETSRKVVTKRWFSVFVLMLIFIGVILLLYIGMGLLTFALAMVGVFGIIIAFLCFIPVLLGLLALFACALYEGFAQTVGLREDDEESGDELLDHLVP